MKTRRSLSSTILQTVGVSPSSLAHQASVTHTHNKFDEMFTKSLCCVELLFLSPIWTSSSLFEPSSLRYPSECPVRELRIAKIISDNFSLRKQSACRKVTSGYEYNFYNLIKFRNFIRRNLRLFRSNFSGKTPNFGQFQVDWNCQKVDSTCQKVGSICQKVELTCKKLISQRTSLYTRVFHM